MHSHAPTQAVRGWRPRQLSRWVAWVCLLALTGALLAAEPKVEPYEVDSNTIHLWHLDEQGPPFKDAVNDGSDLRGMHNGAAAGEPGLLGLGRSISFHHDAGGTPGEPSLAGAIVTVAPVLANGSEDNAPEGFRFQGEKGAFTFEAMLKFDELPSQARSIALAIITMDGEQSDRIFSFRVEREGFLSFTPLPNSGAEGGAIASIPVRGPHAINTKDWFHVAVCYDGRPGVPGSLQLYWTRLDAPRESANRIGLGMLSHKLATTTGDFAIGNEARNHLPGNAEAEPFPGLIDEVRVSSVARHPTDFCFVSPGKRGSDYAIPPKEANARGGTFQLGFTGVTVDGEAIQAIPPAGTPLSLSPGLHRMEFEIGAGSNFVGRPVQLRCQLGGFDEHWQESVLGMSLTFEFLDAASKPLSQAQFNMTGSSPGWGTGLGDSNTTIRRGALYSPEDARFLRVTLSSGAQDTSGSLCLDNLDIHLPESPEKPLWANGRFEIGSDVLSPMRAPTGWSRGGEEPAIALVSNKDGSAMLSLIDGDQSMGGKWTATQALDPAKTAGRTLIVTWREAYNVITGNLQRATFLNVPPGEYVFRAIGMTNDSRPETAALTLPILVRPHAWQRGWFWPAVTTCLSSLVAVALIRQRNRRNRQRLRELAFQAALERDRTRIARDVHDDLGTRITVLNLAATLAGRAMEREPDKARKQLEKMKSVSRSLVIAMDELVWAIDPSHDNLDELASRLTQNADEIFQDSEIRYRYDVPDSLPPLPVGSDFRHNVSMAVREALNNVLKHAGPCDLTMTVSFDGKLLEISILDTGRGFTATAAPGGHGLGNFESRLADIGGTCEVRSTPGEGTLVRFLCPVPKNPKALPDD
ncbi:histidine kinase [Luteolibacter soli]|uniref:Histidine kinase n=1 Tax=Luteolibacter soli TaxID=3135280 RepID=A0ABU9ASB8_9BACT